MIRQPASRQAHGRGSSVAIADGMESGVRPAFCAPDVAGKTPFQKARRGAMSLQVCCINHQRIGHQRIGWPVGSSQVTENLVEHAEFGPASKATAERLVRAAGRSCVLPLRPCFSTQTMPDTTRRSPPGQLRGTWERMARSLTSERVRAETDPTWQTPLPS